MKYIFLILTILINFVFSNPIKIPFDCMDDIIGDDYSPGVCYNNLNDACLDNLLSSTQMIESNIKNNYCKNMLLLFNIPSNLGYLDGTLVSSTQILKCTSYFLNDNLDISKFLNDLESTKIDSNPIDQKYQECLGLIEVLNNDSLNNVLNKYLGDIPVQSLLSCGVNVLKNNTDYLDLFSNDYDCKIVLNNIKLDRFIFDKIPLLSFINFYNDYSSIYKYLFFLKVPETPINDSISFYDIQECSTDIVSYNLTSKFSEFFSIAYDILLEETDSRRRRLSLDVCDSIYSQFCSTYGNNEECLEKSNELQSYCSNNYKEACCKDLLMNKKIFKKYTGEGVGKFSSENKYSPKFYRKCPQNSLDIVKEVYSESDDEDCQYFVYRYCTSEYGVFDTGCIFSGYEVPCPIDCDITDETCPCRDMDDFGLFMNYCQNNPDFALCQPECMGDPSSSFCTPILEEFCTGDEENSHFCKFAKETFLPKDCIYDCSMLTIEDEMNGIDCPCSTCSFVTKYECSNFANMICSMSDGFKEKNYFECELAKVRDSCYDFMLETDEYACVNEEWKSFCEKYPSQDFCFKYEYPLSCNNVFDKIYIQTDTDYLNIPILHPTDRTFMERITLGDIIKLCIEDLNGSVCNRFLKSIVKNFSLLKHEYILPESYLSSETKVMEIKRDIDILSLSGDIVDVLNNIVIEPITIFGQSITLNQMKMGDLYQCYTEFSDINSTKSCEIFGDSNFKTEITYEFKYKTGIDDIDKYIPEYNFTTKGWFSNYGENDFKCYFSKDDDKDLYPKSCVKTNNPSFVSFGTNKPQSCYRHVFDICDDFDDECILQMIYNETLYKQIPDDSDCKKSLIDIKDVINESFKNMDFSTKERLFTIIADNTDGLSQKGDKLEIVDWNLTDNDDLRNSADNLEVGFMASLFLIFSLVFFRV